MNLDDLSLLSSLDSSLVLHNLALRLDNSEEAYANPKSYLNHRERSWLSLANFNNGAAAGILMQVKAALVSTAVQTMASPCVQGISSKLVSWKTKMIRTISIMHAKSPRLRLTKIPIFCASRNRRSHNPTAGKPQYLQVTDYPCNKWSAICHGSVNTPSCVHWRIRFPQQDQ